MEQEKLEAELAQKQQEEVLETEKKLREIQLKQE